MQIIKVRTTQNVQIDYPVAGLFDRILAFLVDGLIMVAYFILAISLSVYFAGKSTVATVVIVMLYLPVFLYNLIFEIAMNGQTPGKKVLEIKVVRLDGGSPTIGNYILRWILRPIDIIFSGSVAIIFILFTQFGQRLGDLAAGTTVIKTIQKRAPTSQKIIEDLQENYQPQFPQVIHFSEKDITVIKEVLQVNAQFGNTEPMDTLTEKIKAMHGIQTDMPPITFLRTVLKDYHYISSVM
jgi:uncharacterized RDD family membrane protein YckC